MATITITPTNSVQNNHTDCRSTITNIVITRKFEVISDKFTVAKKMLLLMMITTITTRKIFTIANNKNYDSIRVDIYDHLSTSSGRNH
jgi:hypothetical protein